MPEKDETTRLIELLVATHGEEGACPTAADWRAIFDVGDRGDGAVRLLNLLKFHAEVDAPASAGVRTVRRLRNQQARHAMEIPSARAR